MNKGMMKYIVGWVCVLMAAILLIPAICAVIYHETAGMYFVITAAVSAAIGVFCIFKKPENQRIYSKEGFVIVALSWIVISAIGALPFVFSGQIPSFIDAFFEVASGFTTTGASILKDVEALSKCMLFWRSFMHWLGGMGVLVFILAVVPLIGGGQNIHLMKAESPGPTVGKLVPKLKNTTMTLYGIYTAITALEVICLLLCGLPLFDALANSFATAGTGGFAVINAGIGGYNVPAQLVMAVFMILFGVNFNFYFFLLGKNIKQAFQSEEVRCYLAIILTATLIIGFDISGQVGNMFTAMKDALFQVASIITTTGFSTADFDLWPELSKTILVLLMFCGACAGSTGGGIKVSRIMMVIKYSVREVRAIVHPRTVKTFRFEGKRVENKVMENIFGYLVIYLGIFVISLLIVSLDNFDFTTNFTAVAATLNNIGPGLAKVGPTMNFASYSNLSKIVLSFDMIAGRLELFPMIVLFAPSTWRK